MFRSTLVASLVLLASRVSAQTSIPQSRDTLARVVVTATRVPIATAAPIASATVLRGDDLRAQGITRVLDALRLVPGAAVMQSGAIGSQTSLFLRGGNSNYVRVLIDGVQVNEPGGAFDFSTLTTDNIDRIEIVRGPASVLYGTDAMTGVVQIFTRDGSRGRSAFNALAGGGSNGTWRSELGWSGHSDKASLSLGGSHYTTDGILAFNNRFINDVLSAGLRVTPDARSDARLAVRWSNANYHFPLDYTGAAVEHNAQQYDHRFVASLDGGRWLTDQLELRAGVTANEYAPRSNDAQDGPTDTLGTYASFSRSARSRHSGEVRLNWRFAPRGIWTVGTDLSHEHENSSSSSQSQYGPSASSFLADRHNASVLTQIVGDLTRRVSYVVGGRLDNNSAFGTFRTIRGSLAYVLNASTRVHVSAGNAFKAPGFSEDFSTVYTKGNVNLRPERSQSAELGVESFVANGALVLKATGYVQRFQDLIQYTYTPVAPDTSNFFNVAAARANGLELEAEYRGFDRMTVGMTYAYTDTRTTKIGYDTSTTATYVKGARLLRRPPHSGTVSLGRTFGLGGSLHLTGTYVGSRDDRNFNVYPYIPLVLPAYTKVDLSLVTPLSRRAPNGMALIARIDNLLGAKYQEVFGYQAPGVVTFVGLRVGR